MVVSNNKPYSRPSNRYKTTESVEANRRYKHRTEERLQAMYNQNVRKLARMKTCSLNEQEAILKSMGIVSVINIE